MLEAVLESTNGFHASDPRDKVFAVPEIVIDPAVEQLTPDYRSSYGEVSLKLATLLLVKGKLPI